MENFGGYILCGYVFAGIKVIGLAFLLCIKCVYRAYPESSSRLHTRCDGLWGGLVDAGAEAAADGDVAGGVVGLTTLVSQFFLSPPFRSSVREPYLHTTL